jgi:hypothetical protein
MYEIVTKSRHRTTVDKNTLEVLGSYNWILDGHGYVKRNDGFRTIYLAREIVGKIPAGMVVDHIDGNPLNNLRSNLRICTRKENQRNRIKTSGTKNIYKGVYANGSGNFKGQIVVDGKKIHLGTFCNEKDAAIAYDNASKLYFGKFARRNFLEIDDTKRITD